MVRRSYSTAVKDVWYRERAPSSLDWLLHVGSKTVHVALAMQNVERERRLTDFSDFSGSC